MQAIWNAGSSVLSPITSVPSILHAAACLGIDYTRPLSEEERRILKAAPYAYYTTCLIATAFALGAIYSAALLWKSASIKFVISLVFCEELSRECAKIAKALSYLLPVSDGQSVTRAAREIRKMAIFCQEALWISKISFMHNHFTSIINQIPPQI